MAIQLDCPACLKTFRVSDATSGQLSVCPHCQTTLRVPVVTIPKAQPARVVHEPSPFGEPESPFGDPAGSPFFADDIPEASVAEPINPTQMLARRNQRRMSRGWIGVILAFVLATVGITSTYFWSNRQNISVSVTARVVANATLSKDLTLPEFTVSPADWGAMTSALQQNPVELTDSKMRMKFAATNSALQLALTPTPERMLVAVPTADIRELQNPSTTQKLTEAWKASLATALTAMSKAIQDAVASGTLPKLGGFGESVGMDGLAGPIGYHFQGAVGNTGYPCVFEDANHQLYFLVPAGTKSLAVVPKEVGARNALPAKMRITATVP